MRRQKGVSLSELMIGIAVGLIVTLAVVSTVGTLNLQRRTTVSGNDAKESAQAAVNVLEQTARQAGTGLFYNGQMLCSTINAYYNGATTLDGASLAPVKITDGGSTASDKITFAYANAAGGSGVSNLVDDMPNTAAVYTVNNRGNLANGDLAVIGVPGSARPCTLFQVTGFPVGGGNCNSITSSCEMVQHNPGTNGLYNPANPDTAWADAPRYGYQNAGAVIGPAVISRLGKFNYDTYEVMCDSLASHAAGATASCTVSPKAFNGATPLVNNVVVLQAQYGISDTGASDIVTGWVSATGSWQTPAAADIPRIKAIRIAVVSRSLEAAATNVSAACTNAAGVANAGPCAFQDADSPVIDVSGIPVPSGKTWRNYRYRVYTSVIPLRNVLWSN